MKITVCDLEPAVSLAHHFRPSVEACPNQANVSFAVGDFFKPETIPKADLYVLSHVLHDWSEDKVDLILSNVYKCLPSGNFWIERRFYRSLRDPGTKHALAGHNKTKEKKLVSVTNSSDQENAVSNSLISSFIHYVHYVSGLIRDVKGHPQFKQESYKWSMGVKCYKRASNIVVLWRQTLSNTPILKSKLTRNAVTALQCFPLMNCNQNELNFEFTVFSL